MIRMRSPRIVRPKPGDDTDTMLKKIQGTLLPAHAADLVAINTDTGEYVLGKSLGEVASAFRSRWPDCAMFVCRVDGGAAVKFHGMIS